MKILLTGYTDRHFGGSTGYFLKLADMKSKNFSYFLPNDFPKKIKNMKKVRVEEKSSYLFNLRLPFFTGNHFVKPFMMLNSYFSEIKVPEKIDLVHVYDKVAITNKPNIHFFDNTPFDSARIWGLSSEHKLSKCYVNYFSKRYLKVLNHPNCKKIVFFSKFARDSFVKDTGLDDSKTAVIPQPIRIEKAFAKKTNKKPIILMVGHQLRRKGADVLLKAFSEMQDEAELVIVGSPDAGISKMINESNNVKLFEAVSDKKLVELYKKADIFCLPSRGEGSPLSILEAMNYSLPVISTNICGIPEEVIDGKTGYLVDVNDVKKLKDRLEKLVKDKALRTRIGKEGKKYLIENFSNEVVENKLTKLYKEALK